jgi:putative ABC transport system substrate-binding protein
MSRRDRMGRRGFLASLGGAAAAWPLAARAQSAMPVIGFLNSAEPKPFAHLLAAFRQGLREVGFVEGRNVVIEQRWAENRYERLPELAADLVRRQVAVIVAGGGNISALAAKAATATIPIVFTAASDPVRAGLVASLNRPGGNVTGIAALTAEMDGKRLELLHELVPKLGVIGVLVNPNRADSEHQVQDVEAAARALGRRIVVLRAGTERGVEAVFATLTAQRIGAIAIGADPFFANHRATIVALAARHAIPAIYQFRDFVSAGGLVSYGASLPDSYRQAGIYAGRIINGAKPAELPVMQATKFELIINLTTAKALGIEIPPALLVRADEVIE